MSGLDYDMVKRAKRKARKHPQRGEGFFGDVWKGIKKAGGVGNDILKSTKIISSVAPMFGPRGVIIGNAAKKLGYGKKHRMRGGCGGPM